MPDGNVNVFTYTNAPTIASLTAQIAADPDLPAKRRQELSSALRCLARWLALPPETIPANLGFLRRKLEAIGPASAGVSLRRFDNVRSLVMQAFRHAGLDAVKASYLCPLSAQWQTLHDRLRSRYERWGLSRFMRFCSSLGIAPGDVDQDTFDRFGTALAEESLVKHPRADHQTACRLWNRMRTAVPDWPAFEAVVPRSDRAYAVSWDDCDPGLVSEVRAYLDHLAGTDLLAARPLTRPMAKRSIGAAEGNLKRFLGALRGAGVDVSTIRSLRDLIALDRVEQGLRWLWDRNGQKLNTMIGDIAWTLRCIAVKHLGVSETETGRFKEIVDRTRTIRHGLSAKNQALLEKFDDRRTTLAFVGIPKSVWTEAERESAAGRRRKAALLVQGAVLVEILMFAPMRLQNLAALDLQRHFSWLETRDGTQLQITIPAEEVKNRERQTHLLPPISTQRIGAYLAHWRPMLESTPSTILLPGAHDGHKDTSTLRKQIKEAMRRHVGFAISPHQFRHVMAKIQLDTRPGSYEVVRKVLGHKSVSTTYEHYAGGETRAASAFFAATILNYGEDDAEQPKRRRRLRQAGAGKASASRPARRPVPPVRRPARKRGGTWKP